MAGVTVVNAGKRLRVQGPRSSRGCLSCKLRHLKCDEAIPVCRRCTRSKRSCYYGTTKNNTPDVRFVVYSLPMEVMDSTLNLSPAERHGLWRFQHHSAVQVEGPYNSKLWSLIVPRLMQDSSIVQQAVLALTTLHERYIDPAPGPHAQSNDALHHYRNARQQIISLKSLDSSFDAILCACIIFSNCEGLLGDFQQATEHAVAGMKMLAAREAAAATGISIFTSAHGALPEVYLELQSQVVEANASHFELECPKIEAQVGDIPLQFRSAEEALPHLCIISESIMRLFRYAEEYHQSQIWTPSQVSPVLKPQLDAINAKYTAWSRAVTQVKNARPDRDLRQYLGAILLQIRAVLLEIDLHVFVHGESTYDDCKVKQVELVNLVERFIQADACPAGPGSSTDSHEQPSSTISKRILFTASPAIVPILFEIATRTKKLWLQRAAISLLRSSNRREGVWDSFAAAKLVERIVELKRKGTEQASGLSTPYRFVITNIQLRSPRECLVQYGFKEIREGAFASFWFETISPDQGTTESLTLEFSEYSVGADSSLDTSKNLRSAPS